MVSWCHGCCWQIVSLSLVLILHPHYSSSFLVLVFFLILKKFKIKSYFWLHWVFVAACGLSLVAVHQASLPLTRDRTRSSALGVLITGLPGVSLTPVFAERYLPSDCHSPSLTHLLAVSLTHWLQLTREKDEGAPGKIHLINACLLLFLHCSAIVSNECWINEPRVWGHYLVNHRNNCVILWWWLT